MSRSSPGVARVVAILNLMAEHPGRAFTLTDIVRALTLSRATCHALLTGLVEANYLYRTSDKGYVLGPALLAVARAADDHLSPLRVAQPEMRALADEFGAVCSAFFREGDEIVVRERCASRSNAGWSVARGTRLPLKPPAATNFVSWSPRAVADRLIDAMVPGISDAYRAELHAGIAYTRRVGFQTVLFNAADRPRSFGWLRDEADAETPISVAAQIETNDRYLLAALNAPVFDAQNDVAFLIGLMGFAGERSGVEIFHMGRRLTDACGRVSEFLAGR